MSLPISRKQMEVLNAFRAFVQANGHAPSVRELGRQLGRAPSTIHQALSALEAKGLLKNDRTAHGRQVAGLAVADAAPGAALAPAAVRVVIRGTIAAGAPIEAIDDPSEVLFLPAESVAAGTYALRVKGDSMIDDHIVDGDIVLVRPQDRVDNGEIAVALLEDGSATLKRVYVEGGERARPEGGARRIRLQPANAAMAPLFVDRVTIQGKAIGIFRGFR